MPTAATAHDRMPGGFLHLKDVLPECMLKEEKEGDVSGENMCEMGKVATNLLTPVLCTLLALLVSLLTMDKEQPHQRPQHSHHDTHSDNDIHIHRHLVGRGGVLPAHAFLVAVVRLALLVGAARLAPLLHRVALERLGIAVVSNVTVSTGDNVDELVPVGLVGDVGGVLEDAGLAGGDVCPPEDVDETTKIKGKRGKTYMQTFLMQTEPLTLRPRSVVSRSSSKFGGGSH
jgi:hypothetical protein